MLHSTNTFAVFPLLDLQARDATPSTSDIPPLTLVEEIERLRRELDHLILERNQLLSDLDLLYESIHS